MATALSSLSISSYHYHPLLHPLPKSLSISLSFPLHSPVPLPPPHHHSFPRLKSDRKFRTLTLASFSFANSSDDMFSFGDSWANSPKKSVIADVIREIEPLDVGLIQKDVPPMTLDAMKRTISGMLGLLPSDRFQVFIEALWDPLSKLLVSSMMTGYTLRNAEYRLCLERNLDIEEENLEYQTPQNSKIDLQGVFLDSTKINEPSIENGMSSEMDEVTEDLSDIHGLGRISPEAQQYIFDLQSRLSSVKKELHETKRKSAALQMQQFVGEEKNDLLDYLRSLQPEKVAELSEPTSAELKETIHSVVHGLLATLSPKMHSQVPPLENSSTGAVNISGEDCAELIENTSLQFQPLISLTRDYLARLLFWCMLLGHYLRGLEYRMELMELLSLTSDAGNEHRGNGNLA